MGETEGRTDERTGKTRIAAYNGRVTKLKPMALWHGKQGRAISPKFWAVEKLLEKLLV